MRLLDLITQSNKPILIDSTGSQHICQLPGAEILAPRIRQCPLRYVLQDDVTELCTQLAFEEDTILGSSIEIVRVPVPNLWIEFRAGARRQTFAGLGRLSGKPSLSSQQRIGLYISSDQQGRKGSVDICWDNIDGLSPEVAPFTLEFDFDDEFFSEAGDSAGACLGVDVANPTALNPLFGRVRFCLRPQWSHYYMDVVAGDIHYQRVLREAVTPLLEDVPFFATFCLLLMSRSAFHQQPSDYSKLNKARTRRGRQPLLDHVELTMDLMPHAVADEGVVTLLPGEHRSSPRLHFVRGHLVRRGDAIFWRTSHMRGKPSAGAIRSRTISLHLGQQSAM